MDEKQNLALLHPYRAEEARCSNSFLQRSKRLIFRVPHDKSGEELAELVPATKAKP